MNKQKGFTVIELMVTLVVLGAGVGALTYLQTRLTGTTVFVAAQHEAIAFANNKIDDLRSSSYDSIGLTSGSSDSSTANGTTFTRTWTVTGNSAPTYKVINVSVSWSDEEGDSHTVNFATTVAETSQSAAEA